MSINRNLEAIIVTLLYLTCLYFWTLPIQKNPVPYGEVDAASHYSVADYTYQKDKSITTLPFYIDKRYGKDNRFKQHTLWYPPPFHMGLAIAALFGGSSDFPIFLANAIFGSLIVLSVYFIIRRFFGFEAALLSGFLLIFSMRDIMVFLWGQWPERMGFAYLPLILYCFYKYCTSYLSKREKPVYLYIMSLLLAVNFFIHPMDFFHSIAALIIVSLFFLIKERRLFFNIKYISASIVLFLLIISIFPLQSMNVIVKLQGGGGEPESIGRISRLFYWFKPLAEYNYGVPPAYFSYKAMIGPYWTIPLIFLGILFLLLRRNKKDLVMLGWLASLYIMLHLDFIGTGRIHRSLSATAHIFYPLMVLGLIYIFSLIPMLKRYKAVIKSGVVILFAVFMFMSVGTEAHKTLEGAYSGVLRVNPYQYDLTRWIRQSDIPTESIIYHMGSVSQSKIRWMWMMSYRTILGGEWQIAADHLDYIIMDYSDFTLIGNQNAINELQEWEKQNLVNDTLIYNNDYIKVYKFENQIER